MKKKLFALILSTILLAGCTMGTTTKKKKRKSSQEEVVNKVTSVSLNRSSLILNLNEDNKYDTETLIATVNGEGEFDKSLTWSSSDDKIATVDNGVVNAVKIGECKISATSVADKDKYAVCDVKVINDIPVIESVAIEPENPQIDLKEGKTVQLTQHVHGTNGPSQVVNWTTTSSILSVDSNGLVTTSATGVGSGTVTATSVKDSSKSATVTIQIIDTTPRVNSVKINEKPTSGSIELDIYEPTGKKTKQLTADVDVSGIGASKEVTWESDKPTIVSVSSGGLITALQKNTGTDVTITAKAKDDPTKSDTVKVHVSDSEPRVLSVNVTLSSDSVIEGTSVTATSSMQVNGNVSPQTVTWSSSNTSVANISTSGVITTKEPGTTEIIATADFTNPDGTKVTGSKTLTVKEQPNRKYTIMMYVCGSNLESQYSQASSDIKEVLSANVSGSLQPDDVDIIIETGGSTSWHSFGGQTPTKALNRYEVTGSTVSKKTAPTNASMGKSSTLQNFVEWGIKEYPAEKMAIIFWNHGGGVDGCCYDDNFEDSATNYYDNLTAHEITDAFDAAFKSTNFTGKFEWVGYDCCLMQTADGASVNNKYFKYQIASQELEEGSGWHYTPWVKELYKNPSISTPTLLTNICDSFFDYYEDDLGTNKNDQVLSWLDLSKADDFTTAFNAAVTSVTSEWSTVKSAYSSSLRFGYQDGYSTGSVDMADLLKHLNITSVNDAIDDLVGYNKYSTKYYSSTKPCGINAFVAGDGNGSQIFKSSYTTSDTAFTAWCNMNRTSGSFYTYSGGWW